MTLLLPALAQAEIVVTATFYPIYIAARNIVKDVPGVALSCLAPAEAGCLHDYQMTTADRRRLADADVLIQNGAGLESFLTRIEADAAVIDASKGFALIGDNPHVWVSVSGAIAQANNIAAGLAQIDPENAALYEANRAAYVAKLETLQEKFSAALAPFAGSAIVTFHEAFDYFAEDYGLIVAASVAHEAGGAPVATRIAEVAEIVREQNVKALFKEPGHPDRSVDAIARETGVPLYVLDPATNGEDADDAYIRIMEKNLETLLEALR